ncbi:MULTISPECIES: electron transfer flavoprotein subunit alpha/FixB family protein [unclassified Xanthobacter]|uniref:electron transfer flavoprotein subunit alpha/FixB family protein n=1 Tax=unclassified Xanthobacter TaxID=2623496 RepID=UPI001EDFF836|nr:MULTISPECIES: electron transfer flavoprotein subunit alpha/FixB family protein [unclassified Xanthobacter]
MSGILILAEHRRGELRAATLEAIGAAGQLKAAVGGEVSVAVIATDPSAFVPAVSVGAVDEVVTITTPEAATFEPHLYERALSDLIAARKPALVLMPHSVDSWALAPAVAIANDLGFATDVFGLQVEEGAVVATRAGYQEKVFVEIDFPGRAGVLVTLRSGAFEPAAGPAQPRITPFEAGDAQRRSRHLDWRDPPATGGIDIPGSPFILSIGRGVGDEANVAQFLELAEGLGATLGCSRPIADNGWLPKARQVGQSGQLAAKCNLYVAMGISGSVQHQWGMKHVENIIAVNKDPEASIFSIARYGIVGDMLEIAEEVRKQKGL